VGRKKVKESVQLFINKAFGLVFMEPIKGEHSLLEDIHYKLQLYGDVTIEDDKRSHLIVYALSRMPEEVRERILNEVTFIVAGDAYGTGFDIDILAVPKTLSFILINFNAMKRQSDSKLMDTIAHEVAHHILGHELSAVEKMFQIEREADDLSESWGFKRAYLSYKQFLVK
jgi:protein required for attachment to host cells